MGFTQPDSAPQEPAQMPAAPGAGPAPVPYGGPDQSPEPPVYSVPAVGDAGGAAAMVMDGYAPGLVTGGPLGTAAAVIAPYAPGSPQPIAGPGGQDIVAAGAAAAVAAASAFHTGTGSGFGVQPGLPGQDFSVATAHGNDYNPAHQGGT
jgi:hypothetical protein